MTVWFGLPKYSYLPEQKRQPNHRASKQKRSFTGEDGNADL
jgi:hypothetical protein